MTKVGGILALGLGVLLGLAVGSARAAPDRAACQKLSGFSLPGTKLKIVKAAVAPSAAPGTVKTSPFAPPLASGLPSHCLVEGVINERVGAEGKTYGIGFALALPENWNRRFLFQGGGGLNGTVNPPYGANAAGEVPALAKGFAVVSNDGGHKGAVFDAAFMADQQASLDFANDSVRSVTLVAKALVAAYYGEPARHAYFSGCSTGGREGMLASQRFPTLFDGIVVGAPAMRTGYSNIGTAHAAATFARISPRDAEGKPTPSKLYGDAGRAAILNGLLKQCDALDGLEDGVIGNVAACAFDPSKLVCKDGKQDGCLSAPQAQALKDAFMSPKNEAGRDLYIRFPHDTGIVFKGTGLPGFLPSGEGIRGPGIDPTATEIDYDAVERRVRADAVQMMTDTAGWTNLTTFLGRGGKILFYHGVSDPWFSALDTFDYWRRAEAANGKEAWANASRFYMVPGMGHCRGGDNSFEQFDLLSAVVDWVEIGKAPDAPIAKRHTPTPAERPMCAHPAYPAYRGGDPAQASSFACRTQEN